jgi:putative ABC transport system permease protein
VDATFFHAHPAIIGQTIRLNGFPCTVVGIAPASFHGLRVGRSQDLWLPLQLEATFSPNRSALTTRTIWWLSVVGTLRAGISLGSATSTTTDAVRVEQPDQRIILEAADRTARQGLLPTPIIVLQGLALSTLLICCVNVTSLLLARSTARQRELALRASLGAGRVRLVRQVLVESGLLVAVGCLLGVVTAAPIASAAVRLMPGRQPTVLDVSPDYRVLLFASLLALMAALGVGPARRVSPTTRHRVDPEKIYCSRADA